MTKPAILLAIDEHLKTVRPEGIRAWGDDAAMNEVRAYAASLPEDDERFFAMPTAREWKYKGVSIVVATTLGSDTRTLPGFERPAEQPRDPETGRFISYEDAENG